jgi:hypothetical protein
LQAFDLGLTPRQLFLLGAQALALSPDLFLLHGEGLMLGEDESLQGFRVERVEIRQGGARSHHDRSMPDIF